MATPRYVINGQKVFSLTKWCEDNSQNRLSFYSAINKERRAAKDQGRELKPTSCNGFEIIIKKKRKKRVNKYED